MLLIRRSQHAAFPEEIKLLETGRPLLKKSPLYKIAVQLDKNGIIVLNARIDKNTHMPVLHAKEDFVKLLIQHFHALYNHGNHATVINELKQRAPHEEVLHTLLLESEHIVNSRPLTPVNSDLDIEALTPNHFLIGRSSAMSPLGVFTDATMSLSSWRTAQTLADQFWRRWQREYRPSLLPRPGAHQNVKRLHEGDVVIIADSSMPRGTWPRGVIAQLFPGPGGHVRVAIVRTRAGDVRRPVSRLIPIYSAHEDGVNTRGGDCRK
ncbi:uncharacterized protein LOC134678931 [Cydia fagiglandana]|uniref:uncharacterized protein LOC134678931 n=1 Tax=Cydia fagiglandana TaxID=1458189 RepID=UPI002FEDF2FD